MLNASPRVLKHIATVGTLAAFTWIGSALAQTSGSLPSANPPSPNLGPTTGQTDTMEHYLTNHPKVADELHNDPSLINNPQWLAQHPTVQNWMSRHPDVKQDALRDPNQFVHHTERETLTKDRRAMNGTDEFLSKHPEMAKQLNENPKLIDSPAFRADHPQLNNYLKEHPGLADEWKNHPEEFAKAARADARYNRTGQKPHINHPRATAKR